MSTLGKRMKTAREGVDREKLYPLQDLSLIHISEPTRP